MARQRLAAGHRRRQIIEAAVTLFSEQGFTKTTTREIAAGAGINEATIYKHFADKEALYDAVIEHTADLLGTLISDLDFRSFTDFRSLLEAIAHRVVAVGRDHPFIIRLMMYSNLQGHQLAPRLFMRIMQERVVSLAAIIADGQREGLLRPDVDPLYAAFLFFASVIFFNIVHNLGRIPFVNRIEADRFIEHIVGVFLSGITVNDYGDKQ